jgi:DNA-binding CsgD family transcriptional regulator
MYTPSAILNTQRQLKKQTLDHWRDGNEVLRSACAEMILSIDDPAQCWQILANAMRAFVDCDRVDAGPCTRDATQYSPIAQADRRDIDVSYLVGLSLPNFNPSLQQLWRTQIPLVCNDLRQDSRLNPTLGQLLKTSGTRSFISLALAHEGSDLGLICLDHTESSQVWNLNQASQIQEFVTQKAAPILAASQQFDAHLHQLTPAERQVARLAANAQSYKMIARTLGKSFSTVDHQLRSIRRKLGVESHIELVRLLQIANLRD